MHSIKTVRLILRASLCSCDAPYLRHAMKSIVMPFIEVIGRGFNGNIRFGLPIRIRPPIRIGEAVLRVGRES